MKRLTAVLLALLFAAAAWGDEHVAASASRADVLTAYTACAPGDTLTIPAGSATWSSAITIEKALIIQGAGETNTLITDYGFIIADGIDNWRITGIRWDDNAIALGHAPIEIGTDAYWSTDGCRDWRVDNCTISGYLRPMLIWGHSTGVVDHCDFPDLGVDSDGLRIWGDNQTSWDRAVVFGSGDFVFIEDCTFNNNSKQVGHFITMEYGARAVFRHNTFTGSGTAMIADWIDTHGFGFGVNMRAARAWEIYGNTFVNNNSSFSRATQLHGGTGVVYDNEFDESVKAFTATLYLGDKRIMETSGVSNVHKWADATEPGLGDPAVSGETYPAVDQIGRGTDSSGVFPFGQALDPTYMWDNVDDHAAPVSVTLGTNCAAWIVEDRDYYLSERPAYTPYTYPHPLQSADPPPTYVFTVDLETADTSQFTSLDVGTNTSEVISGAKKTGSYGWKVTFAGADMVDAWGYHTTGAVTEAWFGFHHLANYSVGAGNDPICLMLMAATTYAQMLTIELDDSGADGVPDRWRVMGSGVTTTTSTTNFSMNAWHWIEMHYKAGTGADGEAQVWVDGAQIYSETGMDFSAHTLLRAYVGLDEGTPVATGYFYVDNFMMSTSGRVAEPATATYSVTYNGNGNDSGAEPTDASSPYAAGATVTVLANTGSLARGGYTIDNWNTAADGSGTDYDMTGTDTFLMPAASVTLYAQWTANPTISGSGTVARMIAIGLFGLGCLVIGFGCSLWYVGHRQREAVRQYHEDTVVEAVVQRTTADIDHEWRQRFEQATREKPHDS